MNAQDWIELAGVIVGGGTVGAGALKVHRLAVAAEKIAAGIARATGPRAPGTPAAPPVPPAP